MVHKDVINSNIDFINKHIESTIQIDLYKEGILGINRENNLLYLNLTNRTIEANIEIHYNSFMYGCLKCSKEDECLVLTSKKTLGVDVNTKIISFEFSNNISLTNFVYYKKDKLIGILKDSICIFNINDQSIKNLMTIDTKYYSLRYKKDDNFYYVSNKILYIYNILKNTLSKKNTHYINVDEYDVVDITDELNIVTCQIHTCVCIWGINEKRTKCFIGHFSPKFKNINKVIEDIKGRLGDEFNNIKFNILGGCNKNITFNELREYMPEKHNYNPLHHALKPYNIIISKKETLII